MSGVTTGMTLPFDADGQALTGGATATEVSPYFPTDSAAELCVYAEQDGTAPVSFDIAIRISPYDANGLNALSSVTTEYYVSYTIASGITGTAMVRYTPIDVAALGYPGKSAAIALTESGTNDTTVYVWVEAKG